MVGDIFGSQQEQEPYAYSAPPAAETRCDELRPCVEGAVFHQYWKHFSSALEVPLLFTALQIRFVQ